MKGVHTKNVELSIAFKLLHVSSMKYTGNTIEDFFFILNNQWKTMTFSCSNLLDIFLHSNTNLHLKSDVDIVMMQYTD